jgi:hypothetical protein
MSSLDEPNDTGSSNGAGDTPIEKMSRLALEARVRELERENAQLKLDIECLNIHVKRDAELFHSIAVEGIPVDQHEMAELKANSKSLSQLLAELQKPEPPK